MIEDAGGVPRGTQLQADVCIVGAGAAGIPLALSLSGKGLSILLLEAGRASPDLGAQSLYEGEVAEGRPHPPPERDRQRGLGGSTRRWAGRCVPFDAIDFEERPHVPHSGWPISYEGLLPYYARANGWLEAGRFGYDARQALPQAGPLVAGLASDIVHTHGLERYSRPTDFGCRYRRRLQVASDLRVLRGAHCTGLRVDAGGAQVQSLDVATLGGNRFTVSARAVVLAAGGLETTRLLLCSNDVVPQGVGNQLDVVGRYYQCHLRGTVGTLAVPGAPNRVRHGYELAADGTLCRRRLGIAAEQQRKHGLLNASLRLQLLPPAPHGAPAAGALALARQPLDAAAALGQWMRHRAGAYGGLPWLPPNRSNRFTLDVQSEQQPLASSRVQLAAATDALGMRRLRVDWRYCRADIESVERTLHLVGAELARSGVGRFDWRPESLEEDLLRAGACGGHHIGTARMGLNPRTSVVDTDCKVHTVDNLYIAGSAVFPTCSQASPTLTLVALALRLADRLAQRLLPRRAAAEELFA